MSKEYNKKERGGEGPSPALSSASLNFLLHDEGPGETSSPAKAGEFVADFYGAAGEKQKRELRGRDTVDEMLNLYQRQQGGKAIVVPEHDDDDDDEDEDESDEDGQVQTSQRGLYAPRPGSSGVFSSPSLTPSPLSSSKGSDAMPSGPASLPPIHQFYPQPQIMPQPQYYQGPYGAPVTVGQYYQQPGFYGPGVPTAPINPAAYQQHLHQQMQQQQRSRARHHDGYEIRDRPYPAPVVMPVTGPVQSHQVQPMSSSGPSAPSPVKSNLDQKMLNRRERNRIAAEKSRQKKLNLISNLQREVNILRHENDALKNENERLRGEMELIKTLAQAGRQQQ